MAEKYAKDFEERGLEALSEGSPEVLTSSHRSAKGFALAAGGMLTQQDARVINICRT